MLLVVFVGVGFTGLTFLLQERDRVAVNCKNWTWTILTMVGWFLIYVVYFFMELTFLAIQLDINIL